MDSFQNIPPKVFLLFGALLVLGFIFLKPKSIPEKLKGKNVITIVTLIVILLFACVVMMLKTS